ncbi:uncharacterized protein [Nicotiana tomentosiformis]|uniref:uncharacterized protein n=1 Tax=Nicotiana tomentosiformis TaxID=4098 RepID=UPI00388C90B7
MVKDIQTITLIDVIHEVTMVEDRLILILMEVIDLETHLVKGKGGAQNAQANSVTSSSIPTSESQGQGHQTPTSLAHFFTQEQYQQIIHLLNKDKEAEPVANAVTTGITDKKVQNILHIPEFKYNLLSVSKLTKKLQCLAAFYPDFCIFQELSSRKVLEIGKEELDTVEVIKNFIAMASTQFDHKLKCLRTNKGTEVFNDQMQTLLKTHGKSPFEKFFQRSPSLQHLRVFGSLCYATTMKKEDKFCHRATPAGHCVQRRSVPPSSMSSSASPLFPVLEFVEQPIQPSSSSDDSSSADADFPAASSSQNYTDAVETSSPSISVPQDHGQSNLSSPISPYASACEPSAPSIVLRKTSRTTKPPVWLKDYVVPPKKSAYPMSNYVSYDQLSSAYKTSLAAFSAIVEPKFFLEASRDPKWVEAMQAEITALEENNTWSIVPLSPVKVPISCKWVLKVKYKSSGEVERYKARLVAKGYSKQEGLDYTETFSPVAKWLL